jgi:hypothetical protein
MFEQPGPMGRISAMGVRGRFRFVALLSLTATVASCYAVDFAGNARPRSSVFGIAAADYVPLASGWKWTYSVWKDGVKIPVLHEVLERQGDVAVVQEGGERITYVVTPEGIAEKNGDRVGDYIIKNPVKVGAEWAVEGGRARIAAVDGKFTSPLIGRYEGCVLIFVTRTDPTRVTQTLFAPHLGPVALTIQAADGKEFLTLAQALLVGVTRPGDAPSRPSSSNTGR